MEKDQPPVKSIARDLCHAQLRVLVALLALAFVTQPRQVLVADDVNDVLQTLARVADEAPRLVIPLRLCVLCHTLDGHHGAARRENLPDHLAGMHHDIPAWLPNEDDPVHTLCIVAKANSIVRRPGDITRDIVQDVYLAPPRKCCRCSRPTANVSCSAEGCTAGLCYGCFNDRIYPLHGLSRGLNYFCLDCSGPGGPSEGLNVPLLQDRSPEDPPVDSAGRPHVVRYPCPTEGQTKRYKYTQLHVDDTKQRLAILLKNTVMRGVDVPNFCRGKPTFPHHPRKDDDDDDEPHFSLKRKQPSTPRSRPVMAMTQRCHDNSG